MPSYDNYYYKNRNLHIVTVSTDSKFYYPYLIKSCKRNGGNITTLGYNQEWKGYSWKFELVIKYLESIDDNDVVCFLDGYDVLCCRNLDGFIDKFLDIKTRTRCKIICGADTYENNLFKFVASIYFQKCKSQNLNSGTYCGFAKDIKNILNASKNINLTETDDQKLLTEYCIQNPKDIYVDSKNELFLVIADPLNEADKNFNITIKKNYIEFNGKRPYFIHGVGCTYLNNILIIQEYNINLNKIKQINNECFNYVFKKGMDHVKVFIFSFWIFILLFIILFKYWTFLIIIILLIIIFYRIPKVYITNNNAKLLKSTLKFPNK